MSSDAKKYDNWIKQQMVNLLEAILTHNSTILDQSVGNIEHGLSFAEDMSPNLIDLAIKFQALLRVYRTEKTPDPDTASPWAWAATPRTASSTDSVDLSELKSALGSRLKKKEDERQRKKDKVIDSLSVSIKDLRPPDEDEY